MLIKNTLRLSILLFSPVLIFYIAFSHLFVSSLSNFSFDILATLFNKNLFFSFSVSLTITFICLYIGSFLNFLYPVNNLFLKKIFRLTVFAPHLAFAYLIYLFFSPTGLLNRVLYPISENFVLINDSLGIGIILHYVLKEIPFVFLYLLSTSSLQENKLISISMDLGAGRWETYWKVFLPLKKESLKVMFILIFSYTFTSYEAPFLLGHFSNQFTSVEVMNNFNSLNEDENTLSQIQAVFLFIINLAVAAVVLLKKGRK